MLPPRENPDLVGHKAAEEAVTNALSGGAMHHAWLITGPKGVGKATLAFRMARLLLSGASGEEDMFGEVTLSMEMDEADPIFRQVAEGSHADLRVLAADEAEGKREILVDEVRKVHGLLEQSSAAEGWRVVIIDGAEQMNRNAANALLKMLEEPPEKTVLLLVSHVPGRLLPTIRSRCRVLSLKPLAEDGVREVIGNQLDEVERASLDFAVNVAAGSPGVAYDICKHDGRALYNKLIDLLQNAPNIDALAAQSLADELADKSNWQQWLMLQLLLNHILLQCAHHAAGLPVDEPDIGQLAGRYSVDHWVTLWEKVSQTLQGVDGLRMDKRMAVIELLGKFAA